MSKPHKLSLVQKITISSIITAALSVISISIYIVTNILPTTDTAGVIESYIHNISADYYETYFFPDLASSIHSHSSSDISTVLSEYTDTGFAKVPLRQILLHSNTDSSVTALISEYCDISFTFVHFFPESPFTATSYHSSYDYSCNF